VSARGYSLERRGKNTWRVEVGLGYRNSDGAPARHRETIKAKTKTEASRKAEEIRDRINSGCSGSLSKITVKEYIEEYLETTATTKAQPSTVKGYKSIAKNYIYPRIGHVQLWQLDTRKLDAFYADVGRSGRVGQKRADGTYSKGGSPLAPATVKRIHEVINAALNQAVKYKIIPINPAPHTTRPSKQQVDRKALNSKEIEKLEKLIYELRAGKYEKRKDSKAADYALAIVLAIGLNTGARLGEILGLQWKHVDFDNSQIRIEQTRKVSPNGGYEYGSTKSKKARTVDIDSELCDFLREHKARQKKDIEKLAGKSSAALKQSSTTPVVLSSDSNEPMRNDTVTNKTVELFRSNGFSEGLSFHCLRHTHASLLLNEGVPIIIVGKRLGHSDIKLTVDTYGHLVEDSGDMATIAWQEARRKARERAKYA